MADAPNQILIVEDEPLIAMELEELVQDLGCAVVGPVASAQTALTLLSQQECDGAILDIRIRDGTSLAVADELSRLGKPWIFTTGCDPTTLNDRYDNVPLVIKPFLRSHVSSLIEDMLGQRALRAAGVRSPSGGAARRSVPGNLEPRR